MGEEVIDHSGLDYYDPVRGATASAPAPRPLPAKRASASPPLNGKTPLNGSRTRPARRAATKA